MRFGEGAAIEAFAALIARLAPEDMALAERSAAWQARARELAGLADVRVLAHDFAVATGALLADAIRVRLARG
ncbi:hypothetical protein CSE45_3249 [Citreicella sp. SE45]|nr:hypothetical protein CSE45_3249 [Citreicella sp. SE45]